ncbi:hypothetical protein GIB67_030747 [Kingdonia uniflora]|uniref:Uncharacterized protein n=1 Tax=Kingdonia uniflora TaxID=39325 RepID=A0A7J7L316_9MAGN|nr:hypothetical protein GIB67_030747 [Kingdonia uniflora]
MIYYRNGMERRLTAMIIGVATDDTRVDDITAIRVVAFRLNKTTREGIEKIFRRMGNGAMLCFGWFLIQD